MGSALDKFIRQLKRDIASDGLSQEELDMLTAMYKGSGWVMKGMIEKRLQSEGLGQYVMKVRSGMMAL